MCSIIITYNITKNLLCSQEDNILFTFYAWVRGTYLHTHIRISTHACERNPVCSEFLQNVCTGSDSRQRVAIMQRTGQSLPSRLSTFHCSCPARPRASSIVPLTLKPLKRSHSWPCNFQRRARLLLTDHVRLWNVSLPVAYIVAPRV